MKFRTDVLYQFKGPKETFTVIVTKVEGNMITFRKNNQKPKLLKDFEIQNIYTVMSIGNKESHPEFFL